ncbi:MAG: amidase [Rhodospirillaceae bacterium]|nr:amidase [Rhodospirillaceae bacterium]
MGAKRPTQSEIAAAASRVGIALDPADTAEFTAMIGDTIEQYYGRLDRLPERMPPAMHARGGWRFAEPQENPYEAWYAFCRIEGAASGKLKGKTVAVKDNICVAGVPMMNGSSTMQGYVPDIDATVVTRTLDAGATVLGKAHCEYFCYSGSSHTNAVATVRNPHNPDYTTGGSSSGCAALVAAGAVDLAIGGDQGGSIREPAAFCGIYGMKPSWGLVPYTGAFPMEMTLDHLGPMTANTADNALFLEVLAGADGHDPRQYAPQTAEYTKSLGTGVKGLRIGVMKEGFGHDASEARVDEAVREAAKRLASLGATIADVSVPMHLDGMAVWAPIAIEGVFAQVFQGNGLGKNWRGLYATSLLEAHSAWRGRANMFSEILKLGVIAGAHMEEAYRGRYYAKAQNLSRQLREAYDLALSEYDLLLMPTTPMAGVKLPPPHGTRAEQMSPGFGPIVNTAPFDCTGHPAMSIPCALREGLPIGMMLVGRHWEEATIYRAADAFERAGDWHGF